MRNFLRLLRERHSVRAPYDASAAGVSDVELSQILEAARWAPTAHNMQNFEIVVLDDPAVLDAIGRIRTEVSEAFLRENYAQLAFSEEELQNRGTGVLADLFPPSWRRPDLDPGEVVDLAHAFLGGAIDHAPLLLIVVYDSTKRAPGSEGDVLGFMSLGCVMQSMWLMAEELGVAMQVLSAFASPVVDSELRRILTLPPAMKVAFAARLGQPATEEPAYPRVRRAVARFTHRNRYGVSLSAAETTKDLLS